MKSCLIETNDYINLTVKLADFTYTKEYKNVILRKGIDGYDPYKPWGSFLNKKCYDNRLHTEESDFKEFSDIISGMKKEYEYCIKKGDKIGFLANEDWYNDISCINCEIEFLEDFSIYVSDYVIFLLDDDLYQLSGEYYMLDNTEIFDINKGLGTEYKYIICNPN